MASTLTGILGGTFDPVHRGHLHIATQVLRGVDLAQLQFMPCAEPVHRDPPRASAEHRFRMLELAVAAEPRFVVSSLELERGGPSYTVDSLRALRAAGDDGPALALILGSDAFNGFASWENPDGVLELAHLIVCLRPGAEIDSRLYPRRRAHEVAELRSRAAGLILELGIETNPCSSTELRDRLAAGLPTEDCLAPEVADYIRHNQLYRKPGDRH